MRSGVCPASPRVPSATATRSRAGRRTAVTKRNLRPLGRPHNLVHGRSEVAHDGRAEDARLRDVRAPRARLHQDAAPPEGAGRLDVAGAVAHERRAAEVDPQRGLRFAEQPRARLATLAGRSEERRVGKEGRSRWTPYHYK